MLKRIAFITAIPRNPWRGSGAWVGISTLMHALRGRGVSVDLIAPRIHLPVHTAERILFNNTLRWRNLTGYDATVGFDLDGYNIAGRSRAPHVAAIKGVLADAVPYESGWTRASMEFQARREALHAQRADAIFTVSNYCAERMRALYGIAKTCRVVPELIDLEDWRELVSRRRRRPGPRTFIVLCVCRFYPRKRVDLLLRAASRLRERIPALEIRIVGSGPEQTRLRRLWKEERLKGTVTWVGNVSRSQLAREYARADVFCLPSVQEGFGIVFLEAMAAGLPIVAARAAAVPEVVRHGILVEPGSDGALADGVEALFQDPGLRSSLAAEGEQYVGNFDAPRVAACFLEELAGLTYSRR